MPIFKLNNKKLAKIKEDEKGFAYEKDLQVIVEENLKELFGLEFVSGRINKQFILDNLELDTIAFDPENKAFVIIEYKKDRSFSVIDQGYSYLALMLNNKADFILNYNEQKEANLKKSGVDWSQSKVIFVAQSFTPHQQGAIAFKDLPIELWEVSRFENNLILFNQLKAPEAKESIKTVSKSKTVSEVSKEVKAFTLENHLSRGNEKIQELLKNLREQILSLDEQITEKPVQNYIGYKVNWYNFVSIHVYRGKLKVYVRKKGLENDPEKRFTQVPKSYEWGKTPLWWIDISDESEIDFIMKVIKESYESAPDR